MGLDIFKLTNPHLHLHFSDDEDTPENDIELDKLVVLADKALYKAKQQGRNCVVSLD
jgi:GGDEF domain-containing protein